MPLERYQALLDAGTIVQDPVQRSVAERLEVLARTLERQPAPATEPARGLLGRLMGRTPVPAEPAPKGLYIHGGVGRGKSMLMDLFFAEVHIAAKRRVHFHAFMLDVQARLHALRQASGKGDPLIQVARALATETRLLCFDEFHVVDIADAMILGRLFEALFAEGMVVVATSNWPPDRLYEDGLNRVRFLPFIDLLKERLDVVALDGPVDYRLERLRDLPAYHYPLGPEATAALDGIFKALADGVEPAAAEARGQARRLDVPLAAGGVARFGFADLCAQPLGAADYLAIAGRYHSVVLDGVPLLTPTAATRPGAS
ncbi:MAG: cell division protein ZapE [Geminicoccaceae bacterium]